MDAAAPLAPRPPGADEFDPEGHPIQDPDVRRDLERLTGEQERFRTDQERWYYFADALADLREGGVCSLVFFFPPLLAAHQSPWGLPWLPHYRAWLRTAALHKRTWDAATVLLRRIGERLERIEEHRPDVPRVRSGLLCLALAAAAEGMTRELRCFAELVQRSGGPEQSTVRALEAGQGWEDPRLAPWAEYIGRWRGSAAGLIDLYAWRELTPHRHAYLGFVDAHQLATEQLRETEAAARAELCCNAAEDVRAAAHRQAAVSLARVVLGDCPEAYATQLQESERRLELGMRLLADHSLYLADTAAAARVAFDAAAAAQAERARRRASALQSTVVVDGATAIEALADAAQEGTHHVVVRILPEARRRVSILELRESALLSARMGPAVQETMRLRLGRSGEPAWFAVDRKTQELATHASSLGKMWADKPGNLLTELCENLAHGEGDAQGHYPSAVSFLAAAAAKHRSGHLSGAAALLQVLYSMEGVDTDALMGYTIGDEKGAFQKYRRQWQDEYLRNPTVSEEFPRGLFPLGRNEEPKNIGPGRLGGAPKALFRIWNWALRTVYNSRSDPTERLHAELQLQRWIKTLAAVMASARSLQVEEVAASLQRVAQAAKGPEKKMPTLEEGMTEWRLYRGMAWLDQEQLEQQQGFAPGNLVPLTQLTSTTMVEKVAQSFLGGQHSVVHLIEMPVGGPLPGIVVWETSKYPDEAEVLLPACLMLEVTHAPEWCTRPDQINDVPVEVLRKLDLDSHLRVLPPKERDTAKEQASYRLWPQRQLAIVGGVEVRTAQDLGSALARHDDEDKLIVRVLAPYLRVRLRPASPEADQRYVVPEWDRALSGAGRELAEAETRLRDQGVADDDAARLVARSRELLAAAERAAAMPPDSDWQTDALKQQATSVRKAVLKVIKALDDDDLGKVPRVRRHLDAALAAGDQAKQPPDTRSTAMQTASRPVTPAEQPIAAAPLPDVVDADLARSADSEPLGIGITLSGGYLQLVEVQPDTPAEKAELRPLIGRHITAVNGRLPTDAVRFTELVRGICNVRLTLAVPPPPETPLPPHAVSWR